MSPPAGPPPLGPPPPARPPAAILQLEGAAAAPPPQGPPATALLQTSTADAATPLTNVAAPILAPSRQDRNAHVDKVKIEVKIEEQEKDEEEEDPAVGAAIIGQLATQIMLDRRQRAQEDSRLAEVAAQEFAAERAAAAERPKEVAAQAVATQEAADKDEDGELMTPAMISQSNLEQLTSELRKTQHNRQVTECQTSTSRLFQNPTNEEFRERQIQRYKEHERALEQAIRSKKDATGQDLKAEAQSGKDRDNVVGDVMEDVVDEGGFC